MSNPKKILLGVLTVAPFFFFLWYLIGIFSFISSIPQISDGSEFSGNDPSYFFNSIKTLIAPMFLLMFLSLGLLIYYLVDIFSLNQNFKGDSGDNKLIWTLVIIFTGFIGQIVYFFIEVYPRNSTPEIHDTRAPNDTN